MRRAIRNRPIITRPRVRTWGALAIVALLISGAIAWRLTRESPEDVIERLGGKVTKNYYGSPVVERALRWIPGGRRVLSRLSTPISVSLVGTRADDETAHLIGTLKQLQGLQLDRTQITDTACKELSALRDLRVLTLSQTAIGDQGLYHLRGSTQLAVLDLHETNVTGAGLRHLERMTNLKELSLSHTRACGRNLEYLALLPNLQLLDLSETPINDDDLEWLRGLQAITLHLRDTQVTEDGPARLRLANRIVGLDLSGTQVNDDVFDHFLRYPDLGRVNVTNTHVSKAGIERFFRRTTLIDVQADVWPSSGPTPQ
jgi:hypothetical protein